MVYIGSIDTCLSGTNEVGVIIKKKEKQAGTKLCQAQAHVGFASLPELNLLAELLEKTFYS
jgi:hypothetical protein